MSDSEESMEVTLSTEAERGASGFTITGGREQGIIVSQVLKESPHSDIFCIKEGDQLLSATIYFDDITYEDALKILQQSEPYKVQFNLKRKLEKEDREKMHSVIQNKPEKQKQDNGDQVYSFKTTEGDKTVRKREHKKKRSKKDRLSWPKFQSITTTGFLGHRSSRSTSETNDEETQDTSRVSELHSEQEDISIKQYEREFPGMELQCRKTASGEQILELETKKQADPQRRLKEKRSLDSSISVKIDHHSVPKTQLRKGESLHSYISTDKSKDKKENIQNVIWRETFPEVIIVKEKTLPSPCKVSPIQKRDQTTILQSSAEERINELSQQTDLGQQVCDVLTHPKDETMMSKQRKKKSKKTILGSTRAQVDDTCEAHSSSSHLNIEFHPFSGNNTEENNIPEDEKVSTSCVAFKRLVNDDAMNEFQTEPSKHYASAKINNTCEFAELQHKNVAEKVESSLSGTEPTSDKGLPGRQHVLSGWKLQMPIIKMPKLPKLQRKSFRSENVEHSNINTTNIRSEGKDSVIIADVPILSTLLTDTASSRTKNIESNKIPVVSYIPKNKEPVATGDIIHQKTILKQKCVQPHLDKNQSDLNIHFLDTEKENYTLLEGERVDKENIHVLYNPVQLPLQDEGSDKLVTKKIKLNTDMMSEIPVPELDMPVTDILSPGQTLPEEAFIEDNANDSNIRLKYEFMCEPNDNESREALLKKPTLKMSSFDTITQKVKDSSEKEYKTIIDLNKDGKKGIVKVKLPKVELSLPQFRGPKGHYKVHTNTDSQSSDNINDVYNKWTFSEELKHDSQLSSYSKHEIKIEKDGVFDNVPTEADINISFIKKNTLEVSENKVNETSEEIDANDTVDFAKDINIIFPHMQIAKYCECISDNNEKETEQKSRTDFKLKKDISTNVSEEKKIIHELKKQDGEKGEQENTITVTSSITGGFSQELDLDNNDISKPQKLKYTPTTNTLQGTNANIDINSDTSEYGTVYSGIHTTISDEKKVSEERKPLKVHSSEMNSEVEVLHSKLEERKGVKITEIPKTIISTERQVKEKTSLTQQFLSSNMKRDFKVADISCSLSPTIEELKSKNEAETVENKIVKKDVFMKVSVERMDIAKKYEDMPIIQPKTKILETVKETSIHEIQPPTSSKPDISHSEQVGESVKEFLSLSVESEPITVSKEEVTVELKQEEERPKPDTDSIQSLEIQKDVKESEVVQKELSIHVKPSVVEHWEVQGKGKRHRKKVTKVEKTIITTENQETGVTSPLEGYTSETKTEFEIEDIDDTLSPTEQELKPQEEMVETATITTETTETKLFLTMSEDRVDTAVTAQETLITEPTIQILQSVTELTICETQLPTSTVLTLSTTEQTDLAGGTEEIPQHKEDIKVDSEEKRRETSQDTQATEPKAEILEVSEERVDTARTTQETEITEPKTQILETVIEVSVPETQLPTLSMLHFVQSDEKAIPDSSVAMTQPKGDISLEIQKDIKESEVVQKELSIQVEPSVEEHWEVQGKGKRRRKKVTKVEKTVIATEYQETSVTSPLEGYTSETKTEFEIEDIDDTLSPTEEELKPQEEMAGTATITTETTEEKQAVLEAESFSPYFTKPIIGVTLIEERISISDGNIIGKKLNVSEGNNKSNTGANFTFQEGPSINFEVEVLKETCDPVSDNNECEVSTTKVQQQSEFLCAEALSGVTSPGPPSTISVKVLEERIYTPDEDIKGSKQSFLSLYDVNTTEGPQETIRELQLLKKDKSVVMYESIPFEETLLEKDTSVLTCDSTEQMLNSYKIDTAKQVEQSFRTVAVNLKEEKKDIDLPKMGDRIHINLDDSGISFDPLKYSVSVIEENIYIEDEGNSGNNLDLECFDALNYTLESSFKTIGRETEIMQTKASKSDDGTATFQEDIISGQDGGTDKIKEVMEDNDLQQHSSAGKSRSLFKLPSFKLPSLSFRRKKESANDPLDETIKDLDADLPHKDFATDLFNESEKLKTQLEIEAGKVKAPLLSKEGEHLKFQLPQLELSKLSTGEITESTGTSTDSLKVIVTKDNMTKTVDTQKEKSQLIKDMSPVNLLSESQPTTISVDSHLEEDIKIEFPYFMAPQISFVDPNDVQSDNAKFYKPVEQMEHGNSQSASEELQTHFIKKQKVNRFGHSGEITDDQFFTEKKKHSVSVSLRNVNLSEKKMKPNRSGFKLSFSKVKKPILPSEPQCESFGIAAHLEKVGIDLAEHDLTCEDELQTVDISCIANTSTLDLNKHQSDVKDADTGPDFGDETSLNEIKKSMKKEMNITPTAVKYITLNEKSSVTAKQFDTDYGLPNFTSHVSSDLPVSTEGTEITIIKGSNKLDEVYSNTIWETKQNTAIDYTSDGKTQTKQPSTENMLLPTQIVKEYEISSSETEKPSFGFSLMKIKLPESHRNVNREESQISAEACTNTEDHLVVSENTKSLDIVLDNTTAEHKPNRQIFYIPKVKTLTLSVKSCDQPEFSNMSEYAETNDGAAKNEMSSTAAPSHDENSLKSKEATSNQSLKFRFHLPSIGFTSSVNKTDNETSIQKVQDTKKIEKEELQTSEKKSWFKVPKLGFSSATEKHLIDKTEIDDPELLAETTEDNLTKESKEKDKGEDSS